MNKESKKLTWAVGLVAGLGGALNSVCSTFFNT